MNNIKLKHFRFKCIQRQVSLIDCLPSPEVLNLYDWNGEYLTRYGLEFVSVKWLDDMKINAINSLINGVK